jgi:hypothetical protein
MSSIVDKSEEQKDAEAEVERFHNDLARSWLPPRQREWLRFSPMQRNPAIPYFRQ